MWVGFWGSRFAVERVEEDPLRQLINEAYESRAVQEQAKDSEAVSLEELLVPEGGRGRDDLLETDSRGPVVQLVNSLLLDAISQRASDVHLQPFEDAMSVRMRIDGVLVEVRSIPKSLQEEKW